MNPFNLDHRDVALIIAGITQVLDVVTTQKSLRRGGTEANPVMLKLMEVSGNAWWVWKLLLASLIVWPLWVFWDSARLFGVPGLWLVNVITFAVVLWNVWVLQKHR